MIVTATAKIYKPKKWSKRPVIKAVIKAVIRALGLLLLIGATAHADILKKLDLEKIHDTIPALEFQNGNANKLDLKSFDRKPLILHFWATWCESCKKELPQLAKLVQDMPNVTFITISADDPKQSAAVKKFLDDFHLEAEPYILIQNKEAKKFIAWGIPMTYFISADRKLFLRARGARDWQKISKEDFASLSAILK